MVPLVLLPLGQARTGDIQLGPGQLFRCGTALQALDARGQRLGCEPQRVDLELVGSGLVLERTVVGD